MAVVVPILTTFNAAGVNAAAGALAKLGGSLKVLGLQAAGAAAGFKAFGSAVDFIGESITSARDLERNLFAMNTVFGSLTPKMEAFTKNAASMGISQTDAARTATFLGSVLKQAGFEMTDVSTETMKLTTLAQDLATTYGYDVSEALTAMTALFRGEYDPIEKFGVALKQNEVNSLLAAKGMGNLTGQALLNAQQQVRLEQLYLRSADAQGAFAAQSNSLYGVQGRLSAQFENLQAALGERLLPVLADFGNALIPLFEDLAPQGDAAFKGLADVMRTLEPLIKPLVSIFGSLIEILGRTFSALSPLINFVTDIVAVALEIFADLLIHVAQGVEDLFNLFSDLGEIVNNSFGSGVTQWLKDFINGSAILKPLLGWLVDRLSLIGTDPNRANNAATDRLTAAALAWKKSQEKVVTPPGGTNPGDGAKKATDYIKEFYAALAEEDRKQRATLKLKSLGATQGLIENILGSGEGWMKVYTSIIAGGKASVAHVQALFAKTKAGIKEVSDAAQAAAEVAKKLSEDALAHYAKDVEFWQKQIDAINAFRDAIKGILPSLKPLDFAEAQIGRFESAVVDSFDQIKNSILEAVANGVLTEAAAQKLRAYADAESAVLTRLAKQRDDLRTKFDLAEALINETQSAVRGYANITAMLDKQTTMVTETVQTMVDGVRLTRTSTREQIIAGTNLVDSFKAVLEKTVAFGKNLKELRRLGLDKNLYKQIVDAGLEAGGQTAAAIIDGGASTVTELNSLFSQLDTVGADIAETSATVMYNNGVDMVGGLLEGLKSQDALLVTAAESMATSFATAFNNMMTALIQVPKMPTMPSAAITTPVGKLDYGQQAFVDLQNTYLDAATAAGVNIDYGAANGGSYGRGSRVSAASVTNNVYVNAGAITDQASLPQVIVDALGTYVKQSGAGGLTRVLGI